MEFYRRLMNKKPRIYIRICIWMTAHNRLAFVKNHAIKNSERAIFLFNLNRFIRSSRREGQRKLDGHARQNCMGGITVKC